MKVLSRSVNISCINIPRSVAGKLAVRTISGNETSHNDSDYMLNLYYDKRHIARLGVSYGLVNYYMIGSFDFMEFKSSHFKVSPYVEAIGALNGKPVITQIQPEKDTADIRAQIPFRDILMQAYFLEFGRIEKHYLLPAFLNYWMNPYIQMGMMQRGKPVASLEGLVANYDKVAQRHGFVFNKEINLFERTVSA